jgi:hypothetical protein
MNNRRWEADQSSRRVIDVAVGVLVALRQCTEDEAFEDLARAVNQTGVGVFGRPLAGIRPRWSKAFAAQT